MSDSTAPASGDRAADQLSRLSMNEGAAGGDSLSIEQAMRRVVQNRRNPAAPNGANGATPANGAEHAALPAADVARTGAREAAAAAEASEGRGQPADTGTLDRLMAELRGEPAAAPAGEAEGRAAAQRDVAPNGAGGIALTIDGQARHFSEAELTDLVRKGANFTQRTQQFAEQQRQFNEQKAMLDQLLPVLIPEMERQVKVLESQIGQDTDWESLRVQDREEYDRRLAARIAYQDQQQKLTQTQAVQQRENERRTQQILAAGHDWLAQRLPMWKNPTERGRLVNEIKAMAGEVGISAAEIEQVRDPRQVQILLYALGYKNMVKRATGAAPVVPVVQRGSAPRQHGGANGGALEPLREALMHKGSIDNATRLVLAQRAEAQRGRR